MTTAELKTFRQANRTPNGLPGSKEQKAAKLSAIEEYKARVRASFAK